MAKFTGNIFKNLNEEEQKEEIIKALPMLQEMMSEADFNNLQADYHNLNDKSIPFWKFVFSNVKVSY